MRLRWKVLLGVLAALAVLLGLNAVVLDQETGQAEVTVPGGKILSLNGGDLQVLDLPPEKKSGSSPIVLIHCYTCAIDWWDGLIPRLRRHHRVIAIDLLGHGGSEKPSSGYSMPEQADLIAEALGRLGVRDATVVGHSLGGSVATALAQRSPQLVSRLVLIDQAPDKSYGQLGLLARLTYWPVLGEALWRLKLDSTIKDGLGEAFAPGFDVPDRFVEDVRRMTFNAYDTVGAEAEDYTDQRPLNARVRATGIPLLAIFGSEDQIYDARRAIGAYAAVRGARTALIKGASHSPNVEKPARVAALIEGFAKPEPEPTTQEVGSVPARSSRTSVARCRGAGAFIGSGRPDWRRHSAVAGPLGLGGSGRDFTHADEISPGTFETKIPLLVAGHRKAVLLVPRRERRRVALLYGREAIAGNIRRIESGFDRVVFIPCQDKPRTVWPGGLLLASRKRITLRVEAGGRTHTLGLG